MRPIALGLLVLIIAAAPAGASPRHVVGAGEGMAIARTTWWPVACQDVTVRWERPERGGQIRVVDGSLAAAYALYPCTIVLSTGLDRYEACIAAVHEVGHLALGPQHSQDPEDPMYRELILDYRPCLLAVGRRLSERDALQVARASSCQRVDQLTMWCDARSGCVTVTAIHTGTVAVTGCSGNRLGTTPTSARTPSPGR